MCKTELDFALGYFTVFSKENLFIRDDCPEEIRARILELWPKIKEETEERHRNGHFSSQDFFGVDLLLLLSMHGQRIVLWPGVERIKKDILFSMDVFFRLCYRVTQENGNNVPVYSRFLSAFDYRLFITARLIQEATSSQLSQHFSSRS